MKGSITLRTNQFCVLSFAFCILSFFPASAEAHPLGTIAPLVITFGETEITFHAPVVPLEILPDSTTALNAWKTNGRVDDTNCAAAFRYIDEHLIFTQNGRKLPFRGTSIEVTSIGPSPDNLVISGVIACNINNAGTPVSPIKITPMNLFTENRAGALQPVGEIKGPGFEEIHFFSAGAVWTQPIEQSAFEKARHALSFILTGIWHIFIGYDHILFLLGLHIISPSIKETLKIVTAFTIAHSVTLVLAATGMISLSSRITEPMIALSIAYIGIENLWRPEPKGRWKTASIFGLVHGFGFAGVLEEFLRQGKMDRATFAGSLFSFNLGVEIGQVAVVALLAPFWMNLKRIPGRDRIVKVISALITFAGLYWFVERVFFTLP